MEYDRDKNKAVANLSMMNYKLCLTRRSSGRLSSTLDGKPHVLYLYRSDSFFATLSRK